METMSYDDIYEYIGVAKRTVQKWVAAGLFPKPIKLSVKSVIFDRADIVQWLQEKKALQENEKGE